MTEPLRCDARVRLCEKNESAAGNRITHHSPFSRPPSRLSETPVM
jgi:hypothetical protein